MQPDLAHPLGRRLTLAVVAASALTAGCVVAPYPYGYGYPTTATTTVATPPSFDKSWNAALGATRR